MGPETEKARDFRSLGFDGVAVVQVFCRDSGAVVFGVMTARRQWADGRCRKPVHRAGRRVSSRSAAGGETPPNRSEFYPVKIRWTLGRSPAGA